MIEYKQLEAMNDKFVIEIIFPGKTNGFCVECGAHDGITNSSCYTLEKHLKYKVLCIEANPALSQKAEKIRNNVLNVAVGETKKICKFFVCNGNGLSGVVNYIDNKELNDKIRTGCDTVDGSKSLYPHYQWGGNNIQIQMKTLKQILDENKAPHKIDYISMDIESAEYPTLKKFFSEENNPYRVTFFSIEGMMCGSLLKNNGYIKILNKFNTTAPYENYYVDKDHYEVIKGNL